MSFRPTWNQLAQWLECTSEQPLFKTAKNPPFAAQIKTDSRRIDANDWFVPLLGETFDGHQFIAEVMEAKRAGGFLYQISQRDKIPSKWLADGIAVKDTLWALGRMAHGFRKHHSAKIVAITGSNGKTSVKEMIAAIIGSKFNCLATDKNFNNEIGVPLTLLQLADNHAYGVIEAGARKVDDIKYLMQIIEPDVGVCLNAAMAHIEIFGSLENIVTTKTQIISELPLAGVGVVNFDQPALMQILRSDKHRLVSFGRNEGAAVQVVSSTVDLQQMSTKLQLRIFGAFHKVTLPQIHDALPINAAAAIAACLALGLDLETILGGLGRIKSISGRFVPVKLGSRLIIDDSYNANPTSMSAGLKTFQMLAKSQAQQVVILGDMLELGPISIEEHAKIGRLCAEKIKPDLLILVGTLARHIGEAAVESGFAADHIKTYTNVESLIASDWSLPENAAIFLKASNGIGLYKYFEYIKKSFSPI